MLESYSLTRALVCSGLPEKIRAYIAYKVGMTVDKSIRIKRNVYIESLKKVKVGSGVLINHGVHLYTGLNNDAQIIIGNNVAIGLDSMITTNSHIIGNENKRWGTNTSRSVIIEDGVWIGANVTILPGVTICRGGIAAGAVVTSSTEANAVYAGVPAKKVKKLEE